MTYQELKRLAFSSGAMDLYRKTRKGLYKATTLEERKELSRIWEDAFPSDVKYERDEYTFWDMWTLCEHLYFSVKQRRQKCDKNIRSIVEGGNAWFITLTWNDDILSTTTFNQRRRYVSDFLNATFDVYVANVDYGSRTQREHYHAVVGYKGKLTKKVMKYWTTANKRHKAFGFIDHPKKIGNDDRDVKRVSTYVAKLSNHAVKVSTEKNGHVGIIYSKSNKDVKVNKVDVMSFYEELLED